MATFKREKNVGLERVVVQFKTSWQESRFGINFARVAIRQYKVLHFIKYDHWTTTHTNYKNQWFVTNCKKHTLLCPFSHQILQSRDPCPTFTLYKLNSGTTRGLSLCALLLQQKWTHIVTGFFIVLRMSSVAQWECLRSPASAQHINHMITIS